MSPRTILKTVKTKRDPYADLSPLEACKKRAIAILNRRPLSEHELRVKLAEKDCAEADIDAVIALCLDYGFLDDRQYAGIVSRFYASKGYGPGRIKTELKKRGIAEEHWTEALAALEPADDTLDRLLAQKLRGTDPRDRKEIERVGASLFRKGYSWDEIRSAVNRYKDT